MRAARGGRMPLAGGGIIAAGARKSCGRCERLYLLRRYGVGTSWGEVEPWRGWVGLRVIK